MLKIKNGGVDQYGKVKNLNGIGGERVKVNVPATEGLAPDVHALWL